MPFSKELLDSVDILERRIGIQKIFTEISSKFSNCPFDMIESQIQESLEIIGKFFGLNYIFLLIYNVNQELEVNLQWHLNKNINLLDQLKIWPMDHSIYQKQREILFHPLEINNIQNFYEDNVEFKSFLEENHINSFSIFPLIHISEIMGYICIPFLDNAKTKESTLNGFLRSACEIFSSSLTNKKFEEERQEQEIRYQNLFNNMTNGFAYHKLILDENNNPIDYLYLDINPAYTELTGKSREEVVGKKITEIVENFTRTDQNYLDIYKKVAIDGLNLTYEHFSASINKWFLVNSYSPKHNYFINIFNDITQQKKTEQQLIESEKSFREVLEFSSDASYRVDYIKNDYVYISPVFQNLTGYFLSELKFEEFRNKIHPDDFIRENERLNAIIKHNPNSIVHVKMEYRFLCKDGIYRWIGDNFTLFKENGIAKYGIGTLRDINERKESEELVRKSEANLREVLELSIDVVYRVDYKTKKIDFISPRIQNLLGYHPFELEQNSILQLQKNIHPEDLKGIQEQIKKNYNQILKTKSLNLQYRMRTQEKHYIWVNENRIFIFDSHNRKKSHIGVIRDISERLLIEKERLRADKIESIGLLAAGIAHDFNNILVSILGNVNLLQMTNLTQEQSEILSDMEKGSFQATNLTKQLLTFSKGGNPIKKTEDITNIIKDSVSFVLHGSKCRGNITTEPNIPLVDIDPGQIHQVLNNLIINANQAMSDGGVININIKSESINESSTIPLEEGTYVVVEVQDNGKGIPLEYQDRIFKPYFTTKAKGNGLGLATCYSIIKQHGGYVNFKTCLNEGTTFFFYLPASQNNLSKSENSATKFDLNTGTILVLDDDPNIHKLLHRLFTKLSIHLDSAYNGTEIIEKYRHRFEKGEPYNLVIMDLTIPGGMGGKETISVLKSIDPAVKAIVSSGYSNDPIMANYEQYGFLDILPKPFTIDEIKKIIAKFL